MAKPTPPPPPPAPAPPTPAGILNPDQFKWEPYGGRLRAVASFVAPGPGNYVIESSTDLQTWVDTGSTWNPSVAGAVWNLDFSDDSLDLYNTAYRARPA